MRSIETEGAADRRLLAEDQHLPAGAPSVSFADSSASGGASAQKILGEGGGAKRRSRPAHQTNGLAKMYCGPMPSSCRRPVSTKPILR